MAREVTPQTAKIRELLDKTKGAITFLQAQPELTKAKLEVTAQQFNNVKTAWKNANEGTPKGNANAKATKSETNGHATDLAEALAFVTECGSLTAARERIAKETALVDAFEETYAGLLA